jgi:hypothetical protein
LKEPSFGAVTRAQFRDALLVRTIANASRLGPYQHLWSAIDLSHVRSVAELQRLPVVDKSLLSQPEFGPQTNDERVGVITFSTGTTGSPTLRLRSAEEVQWIRHFFSRVLEKAAPEGPVPFVLVPQSYHGNRIPIPGYGHPLPMPFPREPFGLAQTVQLLLQRFDVPGFSERVRGISGSVNDVATLTYELRGRRIKAAQLGVQHVSVGSEYMSEPVASFIRGFWNHAAVLQQYSLSEVFGGASECARCGLYHFDRHVAGEVLDPFSLEPTQKGLGVVVLTELYPFIRYRPLIRYWTADLVEVFESPCDSQAPSFRFCGRLAWTPVLREAPGPAVLLRLALLQDALQRETAVRQVTLAPALPEHAGSRLGQPVARVEHDHARLRLLVGVDSPSIEAGEDRSLAKRLHEQLLRDNPELRRLVDRHDYRVEVALIGGDLGEDAVLRAS